ncbi:ABC transporter substrate-binding protein [Oceanirhabdus sp. W0125-5]|uniref:ABC transporter substrate-binding protein n=1 Tax=Oceanirhabdus sp. W0125-5 TaxID=2999116 RepID=UPI0022F2EA7E|nr:extracellular solute-binding protein [Oceanirhabdus sp. W0125-5]WBW98892.1 extracellular solute-binding protein [Oceanirhabdus sp. W0125-5]
MKKIKFSIVLLIILSIFMSACGSKKTDNQQSGSDSKLSGELVYWSMWNSTEPQAQALKEAIDDFMKIHPKVKIKVNWNGREIRKTLQPALDNGQVIDIWDEDLERVTKNWGSYALNLDEYIKKEYPGTNSKPYEEVVMGNLLELARYFSDDNSVYAVPYQPFVFAVMYNKEHFEKAGIEAAPTTWEELLDACAKLKSAGYVPLTTDDAYIDTLLGYHLARLKGSAWVEELVKDKSNKMWDDPAVMQAAKDFQELADKGYLSETVGANKWPAGQQDVAAGTVSMYLNGTWLVNEIMGSTGPDFKWGTFSYPAIEGGVDGISAANYGSQAFQINKNCEHKDVAFELLVHLTTGKWDSTIAEKSFGVPVSGEAKWPTQLLEAKSVFEQLDTVYPWAAGIQADTDKLPVIAEAFTKLLSGQITAEEFINAMKK